MSCYFQSPLTLLTQVIWLYITVNLAFLKLKSLLSLAWTCHIGQITGFLGPLKSSYKGKGYANFQFAAIMNIIGSHLHVIMNMEHEAHRSDIFPSMLSLLCFLSSPKIYFKCVDSKNCFNTRRGADQEGDEAWTIIKD